MKLRFIVSELENFFFFLSNLTEWHFSCRREYNIEWLRQTGPLTVSERQALARWKTLLKKYGFRFVNGSSLYLGQPFFLPSSASQKWAAVRRFVCPAEYELARSTFARFKPRFKRIWQPAGVKAWRSALEEKTNTRAAQTLLRDAESFLRPARRLSSASVHLLLSPSRTRSVAGGANVGRGHVTLEVPIHLLREWNVENGVAILTHEIVHGHMGDVRLRPKIRLLARHMGKLVPLVDGDERSARELATELAVELCAPYGYPCHKAFKTYEPLLDLLLPAFGVSEGWRRGSKIPHQLLMKYLVWHSYPLVASYVEKKRPLDVSFVDKLGTLLNGFVASKKR